MNIQTNIQAIINRVREFLGFAPDPLPDPNNPCNAAACVNSKKSLDGARRDFKNACLWAQAFRSIMATLAVVTSTPIWAIVALVAIALFFGGLIAIIITGLLIGYAVAWLLQIALARSGLGQAIAQALADAQVAMVNARVAVVANCIESCRGDLSLPNCDLG